MRDPSPWRHVTDLLRCELGELADGFRFRTLVLLVVVSMAVAAVIAAQRYRKESELYEQTCQDYRASLAGITVAEIVGRPHPAVKPPWPLAFLAEGDQWRTPNVYNRHLSFWTGPGPGRGELGRLSKDHDPGAVLDWLFVDRVVLSFGAFLLGYDLFCAPRRRDRLRLLLSLPVSRWQVLGVKLFALWSALSLPFVAGVAVSFPLFAATSGRSLSSGELLQVLLFAVLGLWAAGLFTLIACLVSALSRHPERGLVAAALVWLTLVIMIPAASILLPQLLTPLPTAQEVTRRQAEVAQMVGAGRAIFRSREGGRVDSYAAEQRSARIEQSRYEREEEIRRDLARQQLDQVALARSLSSVSPTSLFEETTERLLGTGPERDRRFLEEAWAFEDVLAGYFRKIDLQDPESPHVFFVPLYLSEKPIVPEDVPHFEFTEIPFGERWRTAGGLLAGMIAWSVALLAAVAFVWSRDDLS